MGVIAQVNNDYTHALVLDRQSAALLKSVIREMIAIKQNLLKALQDKGFDLRTFVLKTPTGNRIDVGHKIYRS
ncbi:MULTISPECIES: hypothetical protein [Ochrobactrum]|uniref:Uncharacterized protein n=1 Tax=Ochrobactrum chromiisoli TaxID=2993941 RepID=A0ABT3QNH2_9HYPH|nr:hypothetical protein [Ochrobactrum chromiisoli]MCX2697154.1 hypothetical protein [Ochrobactrum chromiisoli]